MLLRDRYVQKDQMEWKTAPGNINLEHFCSSCPVNKFAQGPFFDLVGNAWHHTITPVYPYQGFKVQPYYDDFSMPTFDGRHICMKGGAWISTGNEATRDARFAFRRHFFQYIGIRYVEADPADESKHLQNVLGLDPEVDLVTDFAYRTDFAGLQNPSLEMFELVKSILEAHPAAPRRRALELFCGAGRLSFELTQLFNEVLGSDFTARKLMPAYSMRERGMTNYSVLGSNGVSRNAAQVKAASFRWNTTRGRATFYQADPSNLHAHMTGFSVIVAWNVLERSYKPTAIPVHLLTRLDKGGLLILGSTFDWSERYAAKSEWLCGVDANDKREPVDELVKLVEKTGLVERVQIRGQGVARFPILTPATDRVGKVQIADVVAFRKL